MYLDTIRSGMIDLIINTPNKGNRAASDGFKIRRTAGRMLYSAYYFARYS